MQYTSNKKALSWYNTNPPKTTCTAGTWKAIPVAKSNTALKSKFWLKDQKGSTTTEP